MLEEKISIYGDVWRWGESLEDEGMEKISTFSDNSDFLTWKEFLFFFYSFRTALIVNIIGKARENEI